MLRQLCWTPLFLPLIFGACDSHLPNSQSDVKRIVLISIDTLRADALGVYGRNPSPTPNIDALARNGLRFENPIAPTPITLPSHTTLLTGLHPLQHGVLVNSQTALSADVVTLAERLQNAGWKTGAIVSSAILHHRYGLADGFDDYRDNYFSDMTQIGENAFELINARVTTREAIGWLQSNLDAERLFLFIHYIDPHSPYEPPKRFKKAFAEGPYYGEVAFVDRQIGRLLQFLKEHALLDGTLLIVTSDHGEGLGDHGASTHGVFLYDEIIRVPLILSGAGIPKGKTIVETVGLIDVTPTILDLAGLEPDPSLPGHVLTNELPAGRSMVSTSYIPSLTFGWSPIWSLSANGEKFILSPEKEYYEISRDPGELENLAILQSERAQFLEGKLRSSAATYIAGMHESQELGIESAGLAQLAALGYVAPTKLPTAIQLDAFVGREPKQMRAVMHLMHDFNSALTVSDFASANRLIAQIITLDPDNLALDGMTSQLLLQEKRYQDLLDWQKEQPAAFRESATERYRRALALSRTGREEEAIELLRKIKVDAPSHVASRYELALLLSTHGRTQQAMTEYEEVLELDPRNEAGLLNYANLLSKSGQTEKAATALETLIGYNPSYATAQRNLGLIYGKLGRNRQALVQLEKYLGMNVDEADRRHIKTIVARLRQNSGGAAIQSSPLQ